MSHASMRLPLHERGGTSMIWGATHTISTGTDGSSGRDERELRVSLSGIALLSMGTRRSSMAASRCATSSSSESCFEKLYDSTELRIWENGKGGAPGIEGDG